MCGIIGATSSRSVGKILIKGLHAMEYRGYDSAGVALNQDSEVFRLRSLGKVSSLEELMINQKLSLALLTQDGRLMGRPQKKTRIPMAHIMKSILFIME